MIAITTRSSMRANPVRGRAILDHLHEHSQAIVAWRLRESWQLALSQAHIRIIAKV